MAGVWDALRRDNPAEARARCALAVAAFDQSSIDKGNWLIGSELCLEDPPPFSSFAAHRPIESWEAAHTKLIDERWLEVVLAKLKDLSEAQEKKQKLSSHSRRPEEAGAEKDSKETKPKKTKGKGTQKGGEAEKTPATQ